MRDARKESSGFLMEMVLEGLRWDERCFLQTQKYRQRIAVWALKLQIAHLDEIQAQRQVESQAQRQVESQAHTSDTPIQILQTEVLVLAPGPVLPLFSSPVAVLAQEIWI